MTTPTNSIEAPFLRTSWDFPSDNAQVLSVQTSRSYLAIANNMNARTIGVFPENGFIANGESWFINGQSNQGLRQFWPFTNTANIAHGINLSSISSFTKCFGAYTDGTNWYGLPFASNTAIAGQVSFYISPQYITFLTGSGAPSVTYGFVCLEWISQL